MKVKFHPHAEKRMAERGAAKEEVAKAVKEGETFPAKLGRIGFRCNFPFQREWRGKFYNIKQIEAYGVKEDDGFLILTVITKYFG